MTAMRRVALRDVATIERDIIEPSAIKSGTLYVGLENIETGGRFLNVRPVDAGELASSKFAFTPQHVLYGKLRPYLAKIARPDFEGICSTDILPVLPGPELDRGYLSWLLLTPAMVSLAASRATGANLPRLSPNALAEMRIPLPPLPEQRRIAEILDKADALRAKRRAALAQLDTLTQSIFLDMFGDPATNPKGWPREPLGQLAETTSGGTPSRDVEEYFGGPIPWVKSGELHEDVVMATEESLTDRGLVESSAKLMPVGTILVAMYGATVGAVALLGIEAATNQAVCCISPSERLMAAYLVFFLRWSTPALKGKRVGGAQPNLSQDLIRKLVVPVPPRELQEKFAERVAATAAAKGMDFQSLHEMNALFSSLQHRAFRGEL